MSKPDTTPNIGWTVTLAGGHPALVLQTNTRGLCRKWALSDFSTLWMNNEHGLFIVRDGVDTVFSDPEQAVTSFLFDALEAGNPWFLVLQYYTEEGDPVTSCWLTQEEDTQLVRMLDRWLCVLSTPPDSENTFAA